MGIEENPFHKLREHENPTHSYIRNMRTTSHIVKKANQRIGLIRRCFTNLTSEKVSMLYKITNQSYVQF